MSKVVSYKNDKYRSFCQIKFDNGERILISIASIPEPSIKVLRLSLGGFLPTGSIWEFNPTMAGGYSEYIQKIVDMFVELPLLQDEVKHPLDAIRDKLLPCKSIDEARHLLLELERNISSM